jgi:hypothetical protein
MNSGGNMDTRDQAVNDYLDATHGAKSGHQVAAFVRLCDRLEAIGFQRGHSAGTTQTNRTYDAIFGALNRVPVLVPHGT